MSTEIFYIEGLGAEPAAMEITLKSKNYATVQVEHVRGLTRSHITKSISKNYPEWILEDLWPDHRLRCWFGQLRRLEMI